MWYLIIKKELYDRDFIETESFITQNPDNFKSNLNKGIKYIKNKIKVK